MINFKSKKGDLTANQIITIIILIVSFAVILLFFFMLNFKGNIDKESCRNSVIMRSALPLGTKTIQLQCKTQTICIYKSGDCGNIGSDVTSVKATSKSEIASAIADLMYDCNWQMGGGKYDYLPSGWNMEKNYCTICNNIYFDDAIKSDKELNQITFNDIALALKTEKTPDGTKSMLYEIYGVDSLEAAYSILQSSEKIDARERNYDLSNANGFVLASSTTKEGVFKLGNLVWMGTGTIIGAVTHPLVGGAVIFAGFALAGAEDTTYVPPFLYENNKEHLSNMNCQDFTHLAG